MCGIAGWIDLESNITSQSRIVEKMSDKLTPRGPDASGYWISEHALIGHRRLVVVDPSGGGQPMLREFNGNKYIITYNGELYNTDDLRKSSSDWQLFPEYI